MLLQDLSHPAFVRPADAALFGSLTASSRSAGPGSFFDVLRREVNEFRVGVAHYRLRSPLLATFYPRLEGPHGRLTVTPSPIQLAGHGANIDEAWNDWAAQFHVRFQTLYGMRPWERQTDERDEWERIEQMVDVTAYQRETPRRTREVGSIRQRRPLPNKVRWETGRNEDIDLSLAPPEFASLFAGQRFEAIVLRDPATNQLLRIVDVIPLRGLPGNAECDALWETVPSSRDLPEQDWDKYD